MTSTLNALRIRQELGRNVWGPPSEWGPDGWKFKSKVTNASIIVTVFDWEDIDWIHASMTDELQVPSYENLKLLHRAVFGQGHAYQMFVPQVSHINIHDFALHLWGRYDGRAAIPNFGAIFGSV